MEFIDLKTQYNLIEKGIQKRFRRVFSESNFIMGDEVYELEEALAKYVGVKHCISCSSGTDALLMPLLAWDVKKSDAVFLPTFSYYATAEVVALLGATPIFVDVEPDTYNLDIEKLKLAISKVKAEENLVPKAVISVDLFGQPSDNFAVEAIVKEEGLFFLEDAAQGFGGRIDNKRACGFGHAAATSFFPAKPLGCYGDGGAVFTNDNELASLLRSIRQHGQGVDKYDNVRIGINGRLDTLQAAILLEKIKLFDEELLKRNEVASRYSQALSEKFSTPTIRSGFFSSWAQYSMLAKDQEDRSQLQQRLTMQGIPTSVYYKKPLHMQTGLLAGSGKRISLEVSEMLSKRIISLPMHPYLTAEDQEKVISACLFE